MNRHVVVRRRGGPERLELVEGPDLAPGPGQALVRNRAVGVAFADVLMREGLYPDTRFPVTPGYEVVGEVEAVGEPADAAWIGRRAAALTMTGGYAQQALVAVADLVAVPDGLADPVAAAAVLNGLTALQMLTRCAPLTVENGRILVWGAAGGVGSLLLDLGRHKGLEVLGVASGARRAFVEARGATAIDRHAGDVAAQVMRLTGGEGVDAVFDGVGGRSTRASYDALRTGGVVVVFGAQGGMESGRRNLPKMLGELARAPRFTPLSLLSGSRGVTGYTVTAWKAAFPDAYRADLAEVFRLAAEGAIRPEVGREFPLDAVADAHRLMNEGRAEGKIVLRP